MEDRKTEVRSRKEGFALVITLVLCFVILIIGTAAITLSYIAFQTTRAEKGYYLAEKAANTCLMLTVERVLNTGICEQREVTNVDLGAELRGGVSCVARVTPSGRICFIRAEGRSGLSTVYKTTIIQGFYGAGLYTVRGGVDATYSGGLLTGCDSSTNCTVPAFITSRGTIGLGGVTPRFCPQTQQTGIWGTPPIYLNAGFVDLTRLFFNVNCFSSNWHNENETCNYGLTDALVDTYGIKDNDPLVDKNATNFPAKYRYTRGYYDFYFNLYGDPPDMVIPDNNKTYGQPVMSRPLREFLANATGLSSTTCWTYNNTSNISFSLSSMTPNPNCPRLYYIFNGTNVTLNGTLPSNVNATIFLLKGGTIRANGSYINLTNPFGENVYNLHIYSAGNVNINAAISNLRLFTNATITTAPNITITNATIIQVLNNEFQNDSTTNVPNFIANGTLYFYDSKIIARHLRFTSGNLYAYRTLFYLYANACPACVRHTSDPNQNPCYTRSDYYRCSWYGGNYTAYVGLDPNRNYVDPQRIPLTSIVINVNSIVRSANFYIGGIYFGQEVNYLVGNISVVRGFLVRNFPSNLSLQIGFTSNTDFQFRLDAINSLIYNPFTRRGFWFVRKVECIREPPTPAYFAIITRMTVW